METVTNGKTRFSDRVEDYVKYRPGYPAGLYPLLREDLGVDPDADVADLGSGTGLLARVFLDAGHRVYGIEPNREMRLAGEAALADAPAFVSVEASAEATTLADQSVGLATAGQAFHWFDPAATKAELRRILQPDGWFVIVWNTWFQFDSPFMRGYADIVSRYSKEAIENHHSGEKMLGVVMKFFEGRLEARSLGHEQRFDFDGLRGRLLSASYAPKPGEPQHDPMIQDLRKLFDSHHRDQIVRFEMATQIFAGRLA